jgi:hypothetical protein
VAFRVGCIPRGAIAVAVMTGFISARLRYQSAEVSSNPFRGSVESGDPLTSTQQRLDAILRDSIEVAKLNRKAAQMTAWSIGIGAVATILGAF